MPGNETPPTGADGRGHPNLSEAGEQDGSDNTSIDLHNQDAWAARIRRDADRWLASKAARRPRGRR